MVLSRILVLLSLQNLEAISPGDPEFVESLLGELSPSDWISGDFADLIPLVMSWVHGIAGSIFPSASDPQLHEIHTDTLDRAYSNEFEFLEDVEELFDESDDDNTGIGRVLRKHDLSPSVEDLSTPVSVSGLTPKSSQESLAPMV